MIRSTLIGAGVVVAGSAAYGQVLLSEDFNGSGNIDTTVFRLPFGEEGTFVGRTQLRGDPATDIPQQIGGSAVLELDTFSPIDPGNAFLGTEIVTKRNFARGGGLRVEYSARLDPASLPAGIGGVSNGLFLLGSSQSVGTGASAVLIRDQIDAALLLTNESAAGTNRVLTNVFDNSTFDEAGTPVFTANNVVDFTQFNDYAVEWTPDSVDYFINGNLVRSETGVVPDAPQTVRANILAFDSVFADAFDAALQPAATAGAGQTIRAEIDSLEVTRFNTDVSENLLVNGGFETPNGIAANTSSITVGGWGSFNNVFQDTFGAGDARVFEGESAASLFGTFNFSPDASGLFQDVAAEAGQEFEASAQVITITGDSIVGTTNNATLNLQFLDASGAVIGTNPGAGDFTGDNQSVFAAIDGQDPNAVEDQFLAATTNAIAPDGTAFVRVLALFATPSGIDGGAVQFDDFSLNLLTASEIIDEILEGDYNGDGFVAQADLDLVLLNFGSNAQPTGFDAAAVPGGGPFDGLVSQNELDGVLLNFGNGTPPASVTAVPEPTTAALLGLAGAGLLARRRRQG